jgi:hypothetical protein
MAKKNKDRISFVEDGMHYMQCEICGSYVQGVSNEAESVTCSRCVLFLITSIESKESKRVVNKRISKGPRGWHLMKEYVDKEGRVFHKGKEVPELKGTLEPTKIKKKKSIKKKEFINKDLIVLNNERKRARKVDRKRKKKLLKKRLS